MFQSSHVIVYWRVFDIIYWWISPHPTLRKVHMKPENGNLEVGEFPSLETIMLNLGSLDPHPCNEINHGEFKNNGPAIPSQNDPSDVEGTTEGPVAWTEKAPRPVQHLK